MRDNKAKLKVIAGQSEHAAEVKNLNRIKGQIEGVVQMIESNRSTEDILTQLSALRSAVKSSETRILQSHIRSTIQSEDAGDTIDDLLRLMDKRLI